ncbi:MAG: hypothetical protein IRZ08_22675 [Frankia sp.]|nr:hypothetical protein [Frankia sp.]
MTAPASAASRPSELAVLPRLPAVVTDPPYDDELPAAGAPGPLPTPRAGAALPGPATTSAATAGKAAARVPGPPAGLAAKRGDDGRRPMRVPSHPQDSRFHDSPRAAAALVVRALVEVLSGLRPVGHLAGWTTYPLQSALERYGGWFQGGTAVRSMRVSEPRPGAAEVSAVVSRGDRAAAIALRMEATDGRWRVTALHLG